MTPFSIIIITFNEEKNIEKCLQSIQDLSDDIIVIDSFSQDNTKKICSKYPIRWIQKKWDGYSNQKNYGNQIAKYNYILSIDADEVLSDSLKQSIQNEAKKGFSGVYSLYRKTNYCGKWIHHGDWYPDEKIRLFPKEKVYWQGDFIHETLFIPKKLKQKFLKGDLLHYSYHSIFQHIEQYNKFTEITANEAFAKQKKYTTGIIIMKAFWKFIHAYYIKFGFLDGYYGFVIAANSAHANFLKYTKLKELNKNEKNSH